LVNSVTSSSNAVASYFLSAVDYDDSTVWTSLNQGLQYENRYVTPLTSIHSRTWVPRIANIVHATGSTSYTSVRDWVDCASDTVPWYGLKTAIPGTGNVVFSWRVVITVRIAACQVR
jgi:hypothetical protein